MFFFDFFVEILPWIVFSFTFGQYFFSVLTDTAWQRWPRPWAALQIAYPACILFSWLRSCVVSGPLTNSSTLCLANSAIFPWIFFLNWCATFLSPIWSICCCRIAYPCTSLHFSCSSESPIAFSWHCACTICLWCRLASCIVPTKQGWSW